MVDHPIINIFNRDCMDAMREMPDKAYDLAIVDPPYGIGNFVQISGNVRGEAVGWNDHIPTVEYFNELRRVSREQIIWGANYYNCFNKTGGAIVWYKQVPKESNLSECEIASYSRLKRVDFVHIKWQNINRTETTIHPCQKPASLYRYLLSKYTKQGDKILDTHGGSMSIAIACYDMGFDLDLFEIDKDYYEAGLKRFNEHKKQLNLFRA